jgi:hypothetical protein
MVTFRKNFKTLLPYNRKEYLNWNADFKSSVEWYGVSFQLSGGFEGRNIGLREYLKAYKAWFKNVITEFDNGSTWIVNHEGRDMEWFPYDQDTLPALRTLFKQNNILNTFKGALIFTTDDLLKFCKDLISYPTALIKGRRLYQDLVISRNDLPFIIKISHHSNIDFLSTDKDLLRKMLDEHSHSFILKMYRGTSL